ncbi:hypothetical protein PR048_030690 [Dryococelus australis]|uniref:Uncharacterized protein n=1 Tax=Dryococelus australis TaxID=614101 RepID=A0ABQ9G9M1_9NEOP|nr:hypothetical protein PR048_030690 [Dryococelus australis]
MSASRSSQVDARPVPGASRSQSEDGCTPPPLHFCILIYCVSMARQNVVRTQSNTRNASQEKPCRGCARSSQSDPRAAPGVPAPGQSEDGCAHGLTSLAEEGPGGVARGGDEERLVVATAVDGEAVSAGAAGPGRVAVADPGEAVVQRDLLSSAVPVPPAALLPAADPHVLHVRCELGLLALCVQLQPWRPLGKQQLDQRRRQSSHLCRSLTWPRRRTSLSPLRSLLRVEDGQPTLHRGADGARLLPADSLEHENILSVTVMEQFLVCAPLFGHWNQVWFVNAVRLQNHTNQIHPSPLRAPFQNVTLRVKFPLWLSQKTLGETGDPRENTLTNGIVRHDSHLQKSGDQPESLWWEAKAWVSRRGSLMTWTMLRLEQNAAADPGPRRFRLLASHQGEPGSIPGGVAPVFSHMGNVPLVYGFSRGSPASPPSLPALLHTLLASPSSALKTSMSRAGQISSHSLHSLALSMSKGEYHNGEQGYIYRGFILDFRILETLRTLPLASGIPRGAAVSPAVVCRRTAIAFHRHQR